MSSQKLVQPSGLKLLTWSHGDEMLLYAVDKLPAKPRQHDPQVKELEHLKGLRLIDNDDTYHIPAQPSAS